MCKYLLFHSFSILLSDISSIEIGVKIHANNSFILNLFSKGDSMMPKDSQIDNKQKRMKKCNNQTPLTAEAQNHNPNAKKHSIHREGFQSQHIN